MVEGLRLFEEFEGLRLFEGSINENLPDRIYGQR